MMEAKPCRKCGSTKTGSVRHGLFPGLAKLFGYRLRSCGGCHRLRLIKRHPVTEPETIRQAAPKAPTPAPQLEQTIGCPYCGAADFRKSRRRWYDRLMRRPKMARCRSCRRRFPRPYFRPSAEESVAQKSA
jgi:hypothetical protein